MLKTLYPAYPVSCCRNINTIVNFSLNVLSIRQKSKTKKKCIEFIISNLLLLLNLPPVCELLISVPKFSTQIQYSNLSILTHSQHILYLTEILRKTKEPNTTHVVRVNARLLKRSKLLYNSTREDAEKKTPQI